MTGAAAFNEFCHVRGITEQIVCGARAASISSDRPLLTHDAPAAGAPVTIGTGGVQLHDRDTPFVGITPDELFARAESGDATAPRTPPGLPCNALPQTAAASPKMLEEDYFELDHWTYAPRSPCERLVAYVPRSPFIARSPVKRALDAQSDDEALKRARAS